MARARRIFTALGDIWGSIDRLNMGLIAAGVGFFAMLAVFPALAAIVMLWSLVADPSKIGDLLALGAGILPGDVLGVLNAQVNGLIRAGSQSSIGWASLLSFVLALWSARAGVDALIQGLDTVYGLPHRAGVVSRVLTAIGLTLVLCSLAILAIAAVVVAPIIIAVVPLGPAATLTIEIARWLLAFFVINLGLGLINRYGPNHRDERPAWVTPGAIAAAFLWLLVSVAFSVYLSHFGRYNQIYGSLGAAVALLMWFYLSAYVVLLGSALNARLGYPTRPRKPVLRRAARTRVLADQT